MTTADPVRIGVLLPTRELAVTGDHSMGPVLEFAREAEELGFHSVWTGDSLTARPRLEAFTTLSAVAAVTNRVTVGTAALTAALRHPLVGAALAAGADQASDGRLVLGLGAGFPVPESEQEFDAAGVPFNRRAARLDETAAVWRRAWRSRSGGPAEHRGTLWEFDGLDRLAPAAGPDGPPLWLAGSDTPRVLDRVARHYDGWLPFLPTAESYAAAWQRIGELAAGHGRPPGSITPALYATLAVDDSRERAEAALDEYTRAYYGRPLELMRTVQAYGWGDPLTCASWLADYVAAGARHLVIRIGSLDPRRQLKEIAETVVPAVLAMGESS